MINSYLKIIHVVLSMLTLCSLGVTQLSYANTPRSVRTKVKVVLTPNSKDPAGCLVLKSVDNKMIYPSMSLFNRCKQHVVVRPSACKGKCLSDTQTILSQQTETISAFITYHDGVGSSVFTWVTKPTSKQPNVLTGEIVVTAGSKVSALSKPTSMKPDLTKNKCNITSVGHPVEYHVVYLLCLGFILCRLRERV